MKKILFVLITFMFTSCADTIEQVDYELITRIEEDKVKKVVDDKDVLNAIVIDNTVYIVDDKGIVINKVSNIEDTASLIAVCGGVFWLVTVILLARAD